MTTHFFLGIGQGKQATRWLGARVPDVVFHAAPNYLRHHTEHEIKTAGVSYVRACLAGAEGYVAYAESQAAPALVEAIYMQEVAPPTCLVLLQPLGLNVQALGATAQQRRRHLLQRSRTFWRQSSQSLTVPGNRWTVAEIAAQSVRYAHHLPAAFLVGANQDYVQKLIEIAQHVDVDVYACRDDSLFPYHEIAPQFEGTQVKVHTLTGTHLNRATPAGLVQLEEVMSKLPQSTK